MTIEPVDRAGVDRLLIEVLRVPFHQLQRANMLTAPRGVNTYEARCSIFLQQLLFGSQV